MNNGEVEYVLCQAHNIDNLVASEGELVVLRRAILIGKLQA
jgi:hypothetical protein